MTRFRFWINDMDYSQLEPTITGAQIRELASVDEGFGVWQALPGPVDPRVHDHESVALNVPTEPRFFTGKLMTTQGDSTVTDGVNVDEAGRHPGCPMQHCEDMRLCGISRRCVMSKQGGSDVR